MTSDIMSNVIITNKSTNIYWVFLMCQNILSTLYVLNYEESIIIISIKVYQDI